MLPHQIPELGELLRGTLSKAGVWASRNLREFSKGKCRELRVGQSHLMRHNRPGADWLESSFAERNQGVPVSSRSHMNQQCALVQKWMASCVV